MAFFRYKNDNYAESRKHKKISRQFGFNTDCKPLTRPVKKPVDKRTMQSIFSSPLTLWHSAGLELKTSSALLDPVSPHSVRAEEES